MPNATLARKILDQITTQPQHFDMTEWFDTPGGGTIHPDRPLGCGTTLCIAGWAAHLTGWTLERRTDDSRVDYVARKDDVTTDGVCDIAILARDLLGLANDTLFYEGAHVAVPLLQQIADGHEPDRDAVINALTAAVR